TLKFIWTGILWNCEEGGGSGFQYILLVADETFGSTFSDMYVLRLSPIENKM
ncbi:unnamed protein product, partial [Brassica rapa]